MSAPPATVMTALGQLPANTPDLQQPPAPANDNAQPPAPAPAPVGPKGPNFDPTGTVPVAGSPADPMHPANQPPAPAPVEGPAPPPGAITEIDGSTTMPGVPKTVNEATRRQYLANEAAAKVVSDQALNAKDQADLQVQADQRKADLAQKQLEDTDRENERQRKGMEAATAERDKLREDTKDFRFHNYWDSRTTGQKILAVIGVILGSASTDPHHVNEAAKDLDTAIAQEWQQQKAELDRKFKLAQDAGEDVTKLQSQYQYESGKLALRQEQQLKATAAEIDALSSRSRNQAGVLAAQKLAADARSLAETQGTAGVKAIADAHSQKLKDSETRAQTANIYSEIAERAAKAERERTGTLTRKEQLEEASKAYQEYQATSKHILQPKTGLLARQQELDAAVNKVTKDGKNPLNWIGLIDSMAKTNTGGKATQAQYLQIYGHAAPSSDVLNQGLAKWLSGNPSGAQQKNFLGAAKDSQSELYQEGHDEEKNFRDAAFGDSRYARNPMAQNTINRLHKATFGNLHGFGQEQPANDNGAPVAKIPFDLPKGSKPTGEKSDGKPVYLTPSGHRVTSDVEG